VLFTTLNNWLSVVDFFLPHMAMKASGKGKGFVGIVWSTRQSFYFYFFYLKYKKFIGALQVCFRKSGPKRVLLF